MKRKNRVCFCIVLVECLVRKEMIKYYNLQNNTEAKNRNSSGYQSNHQHSSEIWETILVH